MIWGPTACDVLLQVNDLCGGGEGRVGLVKGIEDKGERENRMVVS